MNKKASKSNKKIITICGSYRFQAEMKEIAEKLELEGNCVLTPIDLTKPKDKYAEKDFKLLGEIHKEKIKLSDAILVVNVDNYIGNSTKNEIEEAKLLNKEIMYYTDLIKK